MAQARGALPPGKQCARRSVRAFQAGAGGGKGGTDLERAAAIISERAQQEGGPAVNEYFTKRTSTRTDELGEIIADDSATREPSAWTEDAKTALVIEAVAEQLNESAESIGQKLNELLTLVPGLASRVNTMKKADLARLAMNTGDVANKLVLLSELFPSCNVGSLCASRPDVLVMSENDLRYAASTLHELLGHLDIDYMVETEPIFLNREAVKDAVEQAQRLFPKQDLHFFERDPKQLLALQSRDHLIPYDNGSAKEVTESLKARSGQEADADLASPEGW